ncbi:MAG: hypothetical protein WC753_04575 [Candidatus Gracilibacteria bacterium]|jgi:hypothetical protein
MATPTNILTQVQTYQRANLALLENLNCFMNISNTRFKNFQNETANLGSSVTFDLPPRFTTAQGLVASFQPAVQRLLTLTCDQATNTSYAFTAQERIFNVEKDTESYMEQFGRSAIAEMGANIEVNLALNSNSHVPVNTVVNGQTVPTGALHTESGPYRFFGDGLTAINSFQQLAQMIANFKNYGAVRQGIKVILPDTVVPPIVGTGLNQFAPKRNDNMAMSWEVGEFGTPPVMYYQSNLLPIHTAGTLGDAGTVLTVVSTDDPTGANITQITFSGAGTDANAVKSGDLLQFQDAVSGQPNMRFLTFIGHSVSNQPVQVRATANAASSAGSVTISIAPALQSTAGGTQNINNNIVAGMQVKILPSHRCGLVIGGDAFYLAMPRLPDQYPFPTAAEYDADTGVSMRMTYGSLFGQNQMGLIHDATWGSVLVPEYSMRIAFPNN